MRLRFSARSRLVCLTLLHSVLRAQVITTVAGSDFLFPSGPVPGSQAPFGTLASIAVDRGGIAYSIDRENCVAVRTAPDGNTSVIAGNGLCLTSGDGGPAVDAGLLNPFWGALDADGNYYVRDLAGIHRIDAEGRIHRIAGNGRTTGDQPAGDGGPATVAVLTSFGPFLVTPGGELIIVESNAHRIRRVDRSGIIDTIAGTGVQGFSGDGGPARSAQLFMPTALALDAAGNLFVADRNNNRIRRVTPDGTITSVANAYAEHLGFDPSGALLYSGLQVAQILRFNNEGIASPLVGVGTPGFSGDGGSALQAQFQYNLAFAYDLSGNLWIADAQNFRIRRVDRQGIVTTVSGSGSGRYTGDGTEALSTPLANPYGLVSNGSGVLYIAENGGNRVRRLQDGILTTTAGTGSAVTRGSNGDGGAATSAITPTPLGLALDAAGNLYIAENFSTAVRKVSPDGSITSLQRPPTPWGPAGIAVDRNGTLFVADWSRDAVYRYGSDGVPVKIAGNGTRGYSGDGGPALNAALNSPRALALDGAGNLFVVEGGRIRKIDSGGNISTFAGSPNVAFPSGITLDADGNLFVADVSYIRKFTPDGVDTILAGTGGGLSSGDGKLATQAVVQQATNIAVDAVGNVFFTESTSNGRVRAILAGKPTASLSSGTLTFRAPGGGATVSQSLVVQGSIPGLELAVAVDTQRSGDWLSVTPSAAATPRVLTVIADPSNLTPATYQATITIRIPNAQPPILQVPVTFEVNPALPAQLSLDRTNLSFPFPVDGSARFQTLSVINRGGGRLEFSTTVLGQGLSLESTQGAALPGQPAAVRIVANPAGLGPGTYPGLVRVTAGADSREIPVTLTVSSNPKAILLSQTGLSFTAVESGGVVPPQSFSVLNIGAGSAAFTVSTSTLSGGPDWLVASPTAGATVPDQPAPSVAVMIKPAGLRAGIYYGQVRVTAPGAANSPQVVTVSLEVLPPNADPGAQIQPAELVFTTRVGAPNPSSQSFYVYNVGQQTKSFRTSQTADAGTLLPLQVSPQTGSVLSGAPSRIVVQPLLTTFNLTPGTFRQTLTFQFPDGRVRTAKVTLIVAPRASQDAFPGRAAEETCTAKELLPAVTSLGPSFSVTAGWPIGLVADVRDDCGTPLTSGSVSVTFSNGDPPLRMQSTGNGLWESTWHAGQGTGVTLTIHAADGTSKLRGRREIAGDFRNQQNPPRFVPAAVVSAAAPKSYVPQAPGGIISIYGTGLASGISQATALPLPTELGDAQVFVGGKPVPLFFASDGQLNAVLPYGLPPHTTQQILVQRGLTYSEPAYIDVGPAQPGIFLSSGRAIAFAYRDGGSGFLVTPQSPAQAGDILVFYAAGLGPTDPLVEDGAASPAAPLARTKEVTALHIGGAPAEVLFSGLVPGFVGLYQVNARVAPGTPVGEDVPVVITVGRTASPEALLAVR